LPVPERLAKSRGTTNPSIGTGRRSCTPSGFTVLELVLVLALSLLMASMAVATTVNGVNYVRTAAACRYLAARMQFTRLEAAKRGRHVGLRFEQTGSTFAMSMYEDGNGNGIRSTDIARGIDVPLGASERLEDHFGPAGFGLLEHVSDPDTGAPLTGDPIRLGASEILSFAPTGTATSGTIYVRGSGQQQYAVRILGGTGRVRMLKYDFRSARWGQP
jgi:type II secretory pathway pseudopilin PulG